MSTLAEFFIDRSIRLIARCLAAGKLQTVASDIENLPSHGPALIVARHYHHLYDGLTFFAGVRRRCHFVVALDWVQNRRAKFFMRTLNRLARWPILLRADAVPSAITAGLFSGGEIARYRRRALLEAVELLIEGKIVVVFPEGYPTIDPNGSRKTDPEQFLPFKSGFLNILHAAERRLGARIPIIPAGLRYESGNFSVSYLAFGRPIYLDTSNNRQAQVAKIERKVQELSRLTVEEPAKVCSEK